MKNIYLYLLLIIINKISLNAFDFSTYFTQDIYRTPFTSYENFNFKSHYIICKRPLNINKFFDIDSEYAQKSGRNPMHYHMFEVNNNDNGFFNKSIGFENEKFFFKYYEKNLERVSFVQGYKPKLAESLYVYNGIQTQELKIQQVCNINNLSNFGYFDETQIKCNESFTYFPKCSIEQFDKILIEKALKILLVRLSKEKEYSLLTYNCQTFLNKILEIYSILLNSKEIDNNYNTDQLTIKIDDISFLTYKNNLYYNHHDMNNFKFKLK